MARAFRGRGPRRKTQWAGFGSETGTAQLPSMVDVGTGGPSQILSQGLTASGTFGIAPNEEVTITRMIGQVIAVMNSNTALDQATFAIGCIVQRAEAIAAGIASMPSPETSPDAEWLYYVSGFLVNPQNALRDGPLSAQVVNFDVKGQRIIRAGSQIAWIGHAEDTSMVMGVTGRVLFKLP